MALEYATGKKPARTGAVKLRFGSYADASNLPTVPMQIGNPAAVTRTGRGWGMLANDQAGVCVQAGAAHETMQFRADAGSLIPIFTNGAVLADYRAVNPNDPNYTGGTDLPTYLAYRQKIGITDAYGVRHKIEAYTSLETGNLDELALCVYLTGAAGVGVLLPDNASRLVDWGMVWDVYPQQPGKHGHYIPCIGRNSAGNFLFVTWGRLQAATPAWVQMYCDEAVAIISSERLNKMGITPQGFNLQALKDDVAKATA